MQVFSHIFNYVMTPEPEPVEIPRQGIVTCIFKEGKQPQGEYKILYKKCDRALMVNWNKDREQGKRQGKVPIWVTADELVSLKLVREEV